MPSTWGYYRSLEDGEAEELTEQNGHPCIEGEFYCTNEYGDTPAWVEITFADQGVLMMKMARGLVNDIKEFQAIQMSADDIGLSIDISEEWGNHSGVRLKIYTKHAWIEVFAKHTSEMLEIDVSEQVKHIIGG